MIMVNNNSDDNIRGKYWCTMQFHHLLTTVRPLQAALLGNYSQLGHVVLWLEYPFGQVTCSSYAPSQFLLCTYSLADHKEKKKSLT